MSEDKKDKFKVPEVPCIFDLEENKFENQPITDQWVEEVYDVCKNDISKEQFVQRMKDTNSFAAYCFSQCTQLERYAVIYKLVILFYLIDDLTEVPDQLGQKNATLITAITDQLLRALVLIETNANTDETNQWKPYTKALFHVFKEICSAYNETQQKRFVHYFRQYFRQIVKEYQFVKSGSKFRDMQHYTEFRRLISGGYWVVQQIEYAHNIYVPEKVWSDPMMQRLLELTVDMCCITNDIYSFNREYKDTQGNLDKMTNMVALKAIQDGITIEKAMEDAVEAAQQVQHQFIQLSDELLSKYGDKDAKDFVRSAELLMSGNLKFSQITDRYNSL